MADKPLLGLTGLLGLVTLYSYYAAFGQDDYVGSRYWLGLRPRNVRPIVGLQVGAVLGFLAMVLSWGLSAPPRAGVLARPAARYAAVAVFLLASAAWAPLTTSKVRACRVGAAVVLVVAAACSVLFVAGAAEDPEPSPAALIGSIVLGTVVVLCDAVAWNARWITRGYRA